MDTKSMPGIVPAVSSALRNGRRPRAGILLGTLAGMGLMAVTVPPTGVAGLGGLALGALVGAVWTSILGSLDGLVASTRAVRNPRETPSPRQPTPGSPAPTTTSPRGGGAFLPVDLSRLPYDRPLEGPKLPGGTGPEAVLVPGA